MQEREILEDIERLLATALVRAYQNDELIDLYHALREIWQGFIQSLGGSPVTGNVGVLLHQVENTCLSFETCENLGEVEREIVGRIKIQCGRLGEEIACN